MTLKDREEEILETLWIVLMEDKNDTCDIRILKDDESLNRLLNAGHIKRKDNQVRLTTKGKEEAKSCVRRHRLAERLLVDVLDLKKKSVHETSCKFEHLLHKKLDDNICILLGHPKTCPHGRPIPEGKCCKDLKRMPKKMIMPLSEMDTNKRGTITYLQTNDRTSLQKIIAMGALPNSEITLIKKFPSYVFEIGKSQFAIDEELALQIYVRFT